MSRGSHSDGGGTLDKDEISDALLLMGKSDDEIAELVAVMPCDELTFPQFKALLMPFVSAAQGWKFVKNVGAVLLTDDCVDKRRVDSTARGAMIDSVARAKQQEVLSKWVRLSTQLVAENVWEQEAVYKHSKKNDRDAAQHRHVINHQRREFGIENVVVNQRPGSSMQWRVIAVDNGVRSRPSEPSSAINMPIALPGFAATVANATHYLQ